MTNYCKQLHLLALIKELLQIYSMQSTSSTGYNYYATIGYASSINTVHYCLHRFSDLLPFSSHSELTKLAEEFVDYQRLREEDNPQTVWDIAKVELFEEDGDKHYRMDVLWHYSTLKSGNGRQRFKWLSKIAMLVLTIPHSNADKERVFSMVRKNKTSFHPSLGLDKTLPKFTHSQISY